MRSSRPTDTVKEDRIDSMHFARYLAAPLLFVAVTAIAAKPWVAPESARDRVNPLSRDEATLTAARAIYVDNCQSCHGEYGRGDGPGSAYSQVPVPDFAAQSVADQTDGELHYKITEGRRPMLSFEGKLSDEQRWQVVVLVRELAFEAQLAEGESTLPSDDGEQP